MHELSIAEEIVNIVYQYVPNPEKSQVDSVKVCIGKLSNILPDSLMFCFEAITSESPLKGAKLEIIHVPVTITCNICDAESEIEPPVFACPKCGSNQIKITGGTDMRVDSIELNDEIKEKA